MSKPNSKHTDYQYLTGIKTNNTLILKNIYDAHLPAIIKHIKQNKGTTDDAKDVFQEAILIIYEKAQNPEFKLSGSFFSYLYGVCKFLWLRQLKKKHRTEITFDGDEGLIDEDLERLAFEEEKYQLFKDVFAKLGQECQKVLQAFFDKIPMRKIATQMGYTEQYVKLKKYKCKESFVKMMQADARFLELSA